MAKGKDRGGARRAKTEKRKKRERARAGAKAERAAAKAADELTEAEEDEAVLEPLGALFAGKGPLAAAAFDLSALPREAPRADTSAALATWFMDMLPQLATPAWCEGTRALLEGLRAGLAGAGAGAHADVEAEMHPDKAAVEDALLSLDAPLVAGLAMFENPFLQWVFERSCEAAHLEGALPAWVADTLLADPADLRELLRERRRERLNHRLAIGPFSDDLAPDDMPSAAALVSGPRVEASEFSRIAVDACEKDLTPEARARIAKDVRAVAAREQAAGRALYAFDLATLADALESTDPFDQALVRLFYARSLYRRREAATAPDSEWPTT